MTRKRLIRISFYGMTGLIVAFVLLDPYSRQSIFGPTLQGEPFCYWQNEFRRAAILEDQWLRGATPSQSVMQTVLTFLGIKSPVPMSLGHANGLFIALSLADDGSATVRAAVARSLGQYAQSPDANEALLSLLDDPQAEVRLAAVQACMRIGPKAAPAVARLHELLDDDEPASRVFAAAILVEIDGPSDKKTRRVLVDGLKSRDQGTRMDAARSLCRLGKECPEYLADVKAAARDDVYARIGFAGAADRFGPTAIPVLIELLGDSDDRVTCRAARSLGKMGPTATAAIPALVRALGAPGLNTQKSGYEALSKIDPERFPVSKADRE